VEQCAHIGVEGRLLERLAALEGGAVGEQLAALLRVELSPAQLALLQRVALLDVSWGARNRLLRNITPPERARRRMRSSSRLRGCSLIALGPECEATTGARLSVSIWSNARPKSG
jgi:hypothetical protein